MSAEVAVRARGLGTRQLADLDGPPRIVEDRLQERAAQEIAILRRWGGDAVAAIELDEDRRSLRAIARGIVGNIAPAQRVIGAIPTASLPRVRLGRIASAVSFAEVRDLLTPHVLADAFTAPELFEVEHALARHCFAHARSHDAALAMYLTQLVDVENAQAALALSARGGDLDADPLFLAGGNRIDRALFRAAATSPETTHEQLARAFTGTPLATAMFAARPAAIEDAALAWQLATQTQLRRLDPLGLAPVLWLVLRRREETRRLRARAWSAALGGPP